TDAWKVWSKAQIARLQEHLQKVEWRDTFNRKRLANGWETNESDGVGASGVGGAAQLSGGFRKEGQGRIYRKLDGGVCVSFEADLWIDSKKANARLGIFAARERAGSSEAQRKFAEAAVLRHKEGNVQLRFVKEGQATDLRDMQQPFPTERW